MICKIMIKLYVNIDKKEILTIIPFKHEFYDIHIIHIARNDSIKTKESYSSMRHSD